MTTYEIFETLLELNQISADELIKTYFKENGKRTSLIFPKKRDGKIRFSEQELRFTMINLFDTNNYLKLTYSVETPTDKDYSFKGFGRRSASSDLSFYDNDEKILNIEHKAHSPNPDSVDKDIEKLVKEECYGAWCHVYKNEDSGTLSNLFNKFKSSFDKYGAPKKPLYFSFLILEQRKLITRKGQDSDLLYFSPDQIFNLKYADHKTLPDINTKIGDWQINHY